MIHCQKDEYRYGYTRMACRQTDRQTNGRTDRQTNKKTDRQTEEKRSNAHYSHTGVSCRLKSIGFLFNSLFRLISKKISNPQSTGLCEGNHWRPLDSTHKESVLRKAFPYYGITMRNDNHKHKQCERLYGEPHWKLSNLVSIFQGSSNDKTIS